MFVLPHDARARQRMLTNQTPQRPSPPGNEEETPSEAEAARPDASTVESSPPPSGKHAKLAPVNKSA